VNQHRDHRMTVHDAARRLGISEDAVRMRVKRGTLEAEREGGRLYVLLTDEPTTEPTDRTNELIAELRDRVRSLESQLDHERDANRENRRIIAALTSRIPELEPPAPPESPEPREPGPYRVRPERAEPVEPVDPRREEPERVEPERVEPERVEPERVEPREFPETAADEQQGRGPIPDAGGPQEGTQRPWWRRMFRG
jgi:excisionase family DNA binding protein